MRDTYHIPGATYQRTLCGGALHVVGLGRNYKGEEELDWTLRNLQKSGDEKKGSPLTRYLPGIAEQLGIEKIYAPSPIKFNGLVCGPEDLQLAFKLSSSLTVYRGDGVYADGCILEPGQAYIASGAGCAVNVAYRLPVAAVREPPAIGSTGVPERVVAMHTGLMSVLNGGGHNLLRALGYFNQSIAPTTTFCNIEFPIASEVLTYPWTDPNFGPLQQALCEYIALWYGQKCLPEWNNEKKRQNGAVDLAEMMRFQLTELGVPGNNIQVGHYVGRNDSMYTTRDGSGKRNLYLVARLR